MAGRRTYRILTYSQQSGSNAHILQQYGDTTTTIQTEVVVVVCLKYDINHNTTTTTTTTTPAWMVSPYTQHIKTQFSMYNFINILYVNKNFKLLFKT